MKPKIILATLLASLSLLAARADGEAWLWPVVGAEAGDGIIYKPQTYIDKQLNFADLFIAAPLDAEVVAPVDGKVTSIGIGYLESMTSSRGGSVDFDKDFLVDRELSHGDETYFNVGIQPVDSAEKFYFTVTTR